MTHLYNYLLLIRPLIRENVRILSALNIFVQFMLIKQHFHLYLFQIRVNKMEHQTEPSCSIFHNLIFYSNLKPFNYTCPTP